MNYKGYRIEKSDSGLSYLVFKGEYYINSFNTIEDAIRAIDKMLLG